MKKQKFFILFFLCITLVEASAQRTEIFYLSGADKDHTVAWDFFCTKGRNSGQWTTIPVPSNWECQGFGEYTYGRGVKKIGEEGLYKYTFQGSKDWKGKKVFIVFEGAMADTEVKINGKLAGPVHQGGFYQFRYEISSLLKAGATNVLEAKVKKVSSNESVFRAECDGDFWCMGGIYRPVYLEIKPSTGIDRVAVDAKADGSLVMDVFVMNAGARHTIEAQVQTLRGEAVGTPFSGSVTAKQEKVTVRSSFQSPALWNPEFPNLYQVVVSIRDDKNVLHAVTQRFGFRTVEVRQRDGIYVNGKRILLKGVNRHSFWPESGRTLSKQISLQDINLIKDMNMNAVRMSHYPPDQHFLDACDSLGLFVLDELTGWQAKYDTEVGRKLVKELVLRDVNHPSVILWANGNEGGWNTALDDDFLQYDIQKRFVYHPWEKFRGTDTKHYPDYNYVVNSTLYGNEIFFPTEFMHGLYDGGHGAGLDDFWNLMRTHPYSAGGFLWSFHDEGVVRSDQDGKIDTHSNTAPDGIVGPYREKEGSFFAVKEIWSPVFIGARSIPAVFDGNLAIENRYIYTDLSQCSFTWKLITFPSPGEKTVEEKTTAEGAATLQHLAPGEKGFIHLNLPANWNKSDALYFTAYDPHHREIFTWTWPLKTPAQVAEEKIFAPAAAIQVTEESNALIVQCDGIRYFFDRSTGYLSNVITPRATISLSQGPQHAGVEHTLKTLRHRAEGNRHIVEAQYDGEPWFAPKWIFESGKPVKLEYQYGQKGDPDFMGITFHYPEEKITGMKWLGQGPYRVWKNRLKGMQFRVWEKAYNNTVTGESWNYPEFKGYHAALYWVQVQTREASFTVYTGNDHTFLQMLTPARPAGAFNENTSPAFPQGSISFLQAISPIGTKFQRAQQMGPQSQQNMMLNYTPVSGSLWFDFKE
jgi:hypothetical protein